MLRDVLERLNYRYRSWLTERLGDKVGAGESPLPPVDRKQSVSRMVLRHVWVLFFGMFIITLVGRAAASFVPSARFGIGVGVVIVAIFWFLVGVVTVTSELISRRQGSDNDDKSI